MRFIKLTLAMFVAFASPAIAVADNYYDDDIYYDASKAKKNARKVETIVIEQSVPTYNIDDYNYGTTYRDVDEYNRQGAYYYTNVDTVAADSVLNVDGYTYTNRIERFYNPNIVSGSGNDALIESYSENQPIINIYVDDVWDPYPSWNWGYSWYAMGYYPYYYTSWNPYWYNSYWYNPYWYNWGWSHCYDPFYHHHHHHHHSYYPPHHNDRHRHGWYTPSSGGRSHYSSGMDRSRRNSSVNPTGGSNRGGNNSNYGTRGRGGNNSVGAPNNSSSRAGEMSSGSRGRRNSSGVSNNNNSRVQKDNNRSSNRRGSNMSTQISTSDESGSNSRGSSRGSYSSPSGSSSRSTGVSSGSQGGGSRSSGGGSRGGGGGGRGRR